jgi:NMD protein affecting ribosome stability and mRNA decay
MIPRQQDLGPGRDARRRHRSPHEDNYPHQEKAGEAKVCVDCGLVLHGGRWYRGAPPLVAVADAFCPACARVRDGYAAGTIELDAEFVPHRDEIERMIRNEEQAETAEHPLERLMEVKDVADGIRVTTAGAHLARRIANKLERRFHRQARFRYSDGDATLHVDWRRD